MLFILYPPDVNWFYETLARAIYEDLVAAKFPVELVTPLELLQRPPHFGERHDLIISNVSECLHSLKTASAGAELRRRISAFNRRILVNMDCVSSQWFGAQFQAAAGAITDVFDICAVAQTDAATLAGCAYHWIPEAFTAREKRDLAVRHTPRKVPWAMVGHQTPERTALVGELLQTLSPSGLIFLPGLRPYGHDGSKSFSPDALCRILGETEFYIWSSHHRFPYHEGLRSLHALQNGAIPVKICPYFCDVFKDIPWVFSNVDQFIDEVHRSGPDAMYARALEFVLARGVLGEHFADALQKPSAPTGLKGSAHERVAAT